MVSGPNTALLFGASGGLALALADDLLSRGWHVHLVSRAGRTAALESRFAAPLAEGRVRVFNVEHSYADFTPAQPYRACIFTQALFEPQPLAAMTSERIESEVAVGLTDVLRLTRTLLVTHPPAPTARCDFAYIGSTSAYAGFKNTSVYCAVKHGLLGFVRAMNDEYTDTETRFWLFSMGTMNTEMGARLFEQDPTSFLQPEDVAARIAESLSSPSNLFEPEIIMRRRKIRFKPKA